MNASCARPGSSPPAQAERSRRASTRRPEPPDRAPWRRGSFEPLADDTRARVDADEFRPAGAGVRELVGDARRRDDDVAGAGRVLGISELERDVPLLDDPRLVVGVAVQARTLP